jgi:hypothetical protein
MVCLCKAVFTVGAGIHFIIKLTLLCHKDTVPQQSNTIPKYNDTKGTRGLGETGLQSPLVATQARQGTGTTAAESQHFLGLTLVSGIRV